MRKKRSALPRTATTLSRTYETCVVFRLIARQREKELLTAFTPHFRRQKDGIRPGESW